MLLFDGCGDIAGDVECEFDDDVFGEEDEDEKDALLPQVRLDVLCLDFILFFSSSSSESSMTSSLSL